MPCTLQGLEDETNYVRIIGDAGMDIVASMQLNVNEMCQSITSTKLGDDPATYYVVSGYGGGELLVSFLPILFRLLLIPRSSFMADGPMAKYEQTMCACPRFCVFVTGWTVLHFSASSPLFHIDDSMMMVQSRSLNGKPSWDACCSSDRKRM
eukprot:scaffold11864_cov24-Tisochrysis_lutea.AAC.2